MLLTDIVVLWIALILTWALVNRGVPIFQELIRDMTDFFMEKALGPGADLFEGRSGSGAISWMFHGMLWLCLGATFTFVGMWLGHEPDAIASLSGIGYSPSVAELSAAATLASEGGIMMLLLGAGLHINGRLSGSGLASDTNAVLVSYAYSTGLLLGFVGAHVSGDWSNYLDIANGVFTTMAVVAIIANHLLTIGQRTNMAIQPSQWLIIFGLSVPMVMCVACMVIGIDEAVYETFGVIPMLASALAVAHYVVPSEAGVPLWSRTLAGATVFLTFVTLTPIGVTAADSDLSVGSAGVMSIMFAASMIPILAVAMNVFSTARSNWAAASSSPACTMVMIGTFMLVASAVGSLFVGSDAHSGGELIHMQGPMDTLFLWGAMGMIAMGGVMACFPAAANRSLHSESSSRTVLWMFAGGATLAFLFSMSASMTTAAMVEAVTVNELDLLDMSATDDLTVLASIAFYAVTIASMMMMLNMIRGGFSGTPLATASPTGLSATRMALTPGTTTIRQLLAAGAGIDTEIDVISDSEGDEEE